MELIKLVPSLRVLSVLEDAGSFAAAGMALGMTQSAVSQHVASLERQVGQVLVRRGSRPVELTAAGRLLAEHGHGVCARLSAAEFELAELVGKTQRRLRVGSFPTALATFVPRAIAALRAELPGTVLSLVDDHMQGLVPRLHDRELDLALVFGDADRAEGTGLEAHFDVVPLFVDAYRLVVPNGHRLAGTERLPALSDLSAETWIGGGPDSSWFALVRAACRVAGFEPRVALVSDDYLAVQAFVAAGLGVSVVPGLAVARRLGGVEVLELQGPAPRRQIWVAHPRSRFQPPPTSAMIRILQETTRSRR